MDFLYISINVHVVRKFYVMAFNKEQSLAWKSGVFLFLLLHAVIFFGLVLCCTHLSEVTLTIAGNVVHTVFCFIGKFYW